MFRICAVFPWFFSSTYFQRVHVHGIAASVRVSLAIVNELAEAVLSVERIYQDFVNKWIFLNGPSTEFRLEATNRAGRQHQHPMQ